MITVAGEALIDLIADQSGQLDPRPGGGPFNTARAIARLGQPAVFLGRLSGDRFGRTLRDNLHADGVRIALPDAAGQPTTLAVPDIGPAGVVRYLFYLDGTSAAALTPDEARLPAGTTALHIGALGLAVEPVATAVERLATNLPDTVLLMLDPNCRPSAIGDRQAYLDRIGRIMPRVDVLKTSTEDLGYLYGPAPDLEAVARALPPRCVLVTDGGEPVRIFGAAGLAATVEVPPADVVDTVGAGDAFGGAFLAWWTGNGLGPADLGQPDKVHEAARAAIQAAVITCTRRGADPPWAAELRGRAGWDWLGRG
jgi:fructokinase